MPTRRRGAHSARRACAGAFVESARVHGEIAPREKRTLHCTLFSLTTWLGYSVNTTELCWNSSCPKLSQFLSNVYLFVTTTGIPQPPSNPDHDTKLRRGEPSPIPRITFFNGLETQKPMLFFKTSCGQKTQEPTRPSPLPTAWICKSPHIFLLFVTIWRPKSPRLL